MGDIIGGVLGGLFGKEGKSKSKSSGSTESGNNNLGLINSLFTAPASAVNTAGNAMMNLLGLNNNTTTPPVGGVPAGGGTPAPAGGGGPAGPGSIFHAGDSHGTVGLQNGNEDGIMARINANRAARGLPPISGAAPAAAPAGAATASAAATGTTSAATNNQNSALENWANSGGMQFLREQGMKSINANQSAKGLLQSGATGTALTKFNNGLASTYLNQYMQNLLEQQRIGLGAGGLLSSAGQYSNGTSTSTGKSNAGKSGLIPDILVAAASAGAGGGGGGG